jgi:DNA-binding MarR family transcriptional regulator
MKIDPVHLLLQEAEDLGHEARAGSEDHLQLRLWLRLLACTTLLEDEIKKRLRASFDMSLARFDYMAQLYRVPDGMRMKALSQCLMVTGGNVTGLTDELEAEGMVTRLADPEDRRAYMVKLTPKGRRAFEAMAKEHEKWVLELFGGLSEKACRQLYTQLGEVRMALRNLTGSRRTREVVRLRSAGAEGPLHRAADR